MSQSEHHQQWIQTLENEFEKKKKLWAERAGDIHQKTIREIQQNHFSEFLKTGFPSDKDLNWKFTNINALLKDIFSSSMSKAIDENKSNTGAFHFPNSHVIHFHNGVLMKNSVQNLPKDIRFCTWKELNPDFPAWPWITEKALKRKGDGFYHLAGAFLADSYILFVPKNSKVSTPLHIHFSFDESSTPKELSSVSPFWNLRNFIFLEKGAEITLIENVSTQKKLVNKVTDVRCSPHSSLKWLHLDQGLPHAFYLNQVYCEMKKASRIDRLSFSLGAGLSKDNVEIYQLEEKAQSTLLNLALLKEKACRDQKFYVHHSKKEGYSRQLSRGILNDKAKNIFHGKIYVSSEAIKTDCAQSAKNLLLSSTADSYTQPELEINCGEVKAQHGATAGQINKDEVFYLQTRGLEEKKASELLMMGYINDILNQFSEKKLVDSLTTNIQKNKSLYLNL